MRKLKWVSFFIAAVVIQNSQARQCPEPPTAIDIYIEVKHEYDKKLKEYTYTYMIKNGPKGKIDISMIEIETPQDIKVLSMPNKWRIEFEKAADNYPSLFVLGNSYNDIKPNSEAYVFKIKSKLPPGLTRYYAEGIPTEVRKAVVINNDYEVTPTCPGYYTNTETILEQMITGITIGPVATNQVDAKLKMKVKKDKAFKDWDDEADEPEISPLDKGKVEVILHGTKDLDLNLVDLKSIQFGPAKAAPIKAKVIANASEISHWKKKPEDKNKMIWMEFNLADLLIRCDLDKALFLKATAGGKNIFGAVPMKPVLCDARIWKQMGIERKWPQVPDEH